MHSGSAQAAVAASPGHHGDGGVADPSRRTGSRRNRRHVGKDIVYFENEIVGRGNFGTVYRGIYKPNGREMAVKLFRELPPTFSMASVATITGLVSSQGNDGDSSTSGGGGGRVARPEYPAEIDVLAKLRSARCPNIIALHSSWNWRRKRSVDDEPPAATPGGPPPSLYRSSNRQFIVVTELCRGGDLATLQRQMAFRRERFPESAVRSLIFQLCNALHVLHSRRIIHRDVKPANLLLTSTDVNRAQLKLADFGMSREAPPLTAEQHLQQLQQEQRRQRQLFRDDDSSSGNNGGGASRNRQHFLANANDNMFESGLGTPLYMSPERIRNEPYSFNADVFSAGMVLHELMTGEQIMARSAMHLCVVVPRVLEMLTRRHTRSGTQPMPDWLDLLLGMAHADPARRLSAEDALRHRWFTAEGGPPLPAPTPGEACCRGAAGGEARRPCERGGAGGVGAAGDGCRGPIPPQPSAPAEEEQFTESSIFGSHRPESPAPAGAAAAAPAWWRVLAVGSASSPPSSSPSPPPQLSLPAACGPHIVTHAVRNAVDAVIAYALDDEPDATRALVIVAFLTGLVEQGYDAFTREMMAYGSASGRAPAETLPCHRLGSQWTALTARLEELAGEKRKRLPADLLAAVTSSRLRLLGAAESGGAPAGAAASSATAPRPRAEALLFRRATRLVQNQAVNDKIAYAAWSTPGPVDELKRGLALLRVLLQQAVLTREEVGLPPGGTGADDTVYLVHVPINPGAHIVAHARQGAAFVQLIGRITQYAAVQAQARE